MRRIPAVAALVLSSVVLLPAATLIDDPKTFVSGVYQHYIAAQSSHSDYSAPEDIYTQRLRKLILDDRRKAHGEVGCLEIDFWVNGQDYEISHLTVTSSDEGPDRKTIIAKFVNLGDPEEIHFDFRRVAGRWLIDEVQCVSRTPWKLSEILKCTP